MGHSKRSGRRRRRGRGAEQENREQEAGLLETVRQGEDLPWGGNRGGGAAAARWTRVVALGGAG